MWSGQYPAEHVVTSRLIRIDSTVLCADDMFMVSSVPGKFVNEKFHSKFWFYGFCAAYSLRTLVFQCHKLTGAMATSHDKRKHMFIKYYSLLNLAIHAVLAV